jgi:hypothetical protein
MTVTAWSKRRSYGTIQSRGNGLFVVSILIILIPLLSLLANRLVCHGLSDMYNTECEMKMRLKKNGWRELGDGRFRSVVGGGRGKLGASFETTFIPLSPKYLIQQSTHSPSGAI